MLDSLLALFEQSVSGTVSPALATTRNRGTGFGVDVDVVAKPSSFL